MSAIISAWAEMRELIENERVSCEMRETWHVYIHGSLSSPESTQMASVQPFLHSSLQSIPILYNDHDRPAD